MIAHARWLALVLLFGCGEKFDPRRDCDVAVSATFDDVKPIFAAHCLRCHSIELRGAARQEAPSDINFDTYADATAVIFGNETTADLAAREMQAGTMPADAPLSLPQEQICLVQAWVDQGAPE